MCDTSDDSVDDAGVRGHRDDVDDDCGHRTQEWILQEGNWNM